MHILVLKVLHRRHLHEALRGSWALVVDRGLLVMLHVEVRHRELLPGLGNLLLLLVKTMLQARLRRHLLSLLL